MPFARCFTRWIRLIGPAGRAVGFAVLLAGSAEAQAPSSVQVPGSEVVQGPGPSVGAPSCRECTGGERDAARRTSLAPDAPVTVTPDGKTVIAPRLMREQGDFRLGDALKNVPGVTGR